MTALPEKQTTSIATSTPDDVFIRDKSLCKELIGKVTFTQMIYFQVLGKMPTPAQAALVDACLVTLMEHGLTPSALATRLIYSSAEEAMQAARETPVLARETLLGLASPGLEIFGHLTPPRKGATRRREAALDQTTQCRDVGLSGPEAPAGRQRTRERSHDRSIGSQVAPSATAGHRPRE